MVELAGGASAAVTRLMSSNDLDGARGNALQLLLLIVVTDERGIRQAIQRSFPGVEFIFASTIEQADAIARSGIVSGFYLF